MQVTVTGATGHIGGNLVRALLREGGPGLRIRALAHGHEQRTLEGLPVEVVRGDLTDPGFARRAIDGSDLVYHLAAAISLDPQDEPQMERVNVGATGNVIAACREGRAGRLVYFSSIHAFSSRPRGRVCDESSPLADGDRDAPAYDRTKARALRLVREAAAGGLDVVMVHPTGVLGPNDFRPSPMGCLLRDLARRRMAACVTGGFNFVDVRDVVASAIQAARRGRTGESYLLGGEWISIPDIAAIVERVSGRRRPRWIVPMVVARLTAPLAVAWFRFRGRPPLVTSASLHALRTHRQVCDCKATSELGHAPRPVARAVEETVSWMRENRIFE